MVSILSPGPIGGFDDELLLGELLEDLSHDLPHALQGLEVVLALIVLLGETLELVSHGAKARLDLTVLQELLPVVGEGLLFGGVHGVGGHRGWMDDRVSENRLWKWIGKSFNFYCQK